MGGVKCRGIGRKGFWGYLVGKDVDRGLWSYFEYIRFYYIYDFLFLFLDFFVVVEVCFEGDFIKRMDVVDNLG